MATKEQVESTLEQVMVPVVMRSVMDMNLLRGLEIKGANMKVSISNAALSDEVREQLRSEIQDKLISLDGVDMFDVGTGSGILSIAAGKLGASPIRAVDIDDVAVRVAKENFELNGLPKIETGIGSADAHGGKQWSLVVANILSNILIDIMVDLKQSLAPDGQLILSGIINEQEQPTFR